MSVLDALFFIYVKNSRKQRVVFPEDKGVVEILQDIPCHFLNFVAWIYHVDAGVDCVLDFEGYSSCMPMQVLGLALESVESVGVLQVESCDTSHIFSPI